MEIQNIQKLQELQNTNYGTCINYNCVFEHFANSVVLKCMLALFGVICTINCYFEYRIWILCIFLYMGTYFKDIFRTRK